MDLYSIKSVGGTVKDVDVKNRIVTGYFASFDTLDSDGDIFQKGAFKRSINNNAKRIMHLLQHDPSKPIGRPEVKEDSRGLYFETKFTDAQMNVKYIEDTLNLYEAGVYNEHSVGFQTVNQERKSDHNLITEVKLWEGSTVTWGANENTPMAGMKSLFKSKEDITERINLISKAIGGGNFSDETYNQLTLSLEQLKALLTVDSTQVTPEPVPNSLKAEDIMEAYLIINGKLK